MARYTMRQRLVSIGEDFDIADEHGNPVFRVDGKVMRLRDTFVLEDLQGREVATIREKKLALRESMNILRAGTTIARSARRGSHRFAISSRSMWRGARTSSPRETSCTTSTNSAAETTRSPAYQSAGSR